MMFSCFVQLSNYLISRNFDAMQQYRKSNCSDVFCLNCIFVIDATVKHLISRSFLKCDVSAVTMAAHKNLKKNCQIKSSFYSFYCTCCRLVPKRGNVWLGPTPRLSAWATQFRKVVAAAVSRWLHCVRFDRLRN